MKRDDLFKPGEYFSIPLALAAVPARLLSSNCKLVWSLIANELRDNTEAWPTEKTIAASSGMDLRVVERSIKKLKCSGWLQSRQVIVRDDAGNAKRRNYYTLLTPPVQNVGYPPPPVQNVGLNPSKTSGSTRLKRRAQPVQNVGLYTVLANVVNNEAITDVASGTALPSSEPKDQPEGSTHHSASHDQPEGSIHPTASHHDRPSVSAHHDHPKPDGSSTKDHSCAGATLDIDSRLQESINAPAAAEQSAVAGTDTCTGTSLAANGQKNASAPSGPTVTRPKPSKSTGAASTGQQSASADGPKPTELACRDIESMETYIRFGAPGLAGDRSKSSKMDYRLSPARHWDAQQFAGYLWFMVSRAKTMVNPPIPLSIPESWGAIIKICKDKLAPGELGAERLFRRVETVCSHWPLIKSKWWGRDLILSERLFRDSRVAELCQQLESMTQEQIEAEYAALAPAENEDFDWSEAA